MQKKIQKRKLLQQVSIIHTSGPLDYIHLQKTLGHIHNHHTLVSQANSSY
jgi:hypothetical protein